MRAQIGILPAYIAGAYEALPKGNVVPRSRDLGVTFGPFLSAQFLASLVIDLPAQQGPRLISALTQRIVEGLRDGVVVSVSDAAAIRAQWNGQELGPIERSRRGRKPPTSQLRPAAGIAGSVGATPNAASGSEGQPRTHRHQRGPAGPGGPT
jgi:hypothetical protein